MSVCDRGVVKDSTGSVLPGATVTITHEAQALTLTSVTREDGTYIFTPIRTGTYTIEVDFPGFKKAGRRGVTVGIQQQALVDFTLETGALSETILVTADSPLLQTGSGTVGETLKSDVIEDLPINGRDYTVLARLTSGVPGAKVMSIEARRRRRRRRLALPARPGLPGACGRGRGGSRSRRRSIRRRR